MTKEKNTCKACSKWKAGQAIVVFTEGIDCYCVECRKLIKPPEIEGGKITDNGDGTIDISSGSMTLISYEIQPDGDLKEVETLEGGCGILKNKMVRASPEVPTLMDELQSYPNTYAGLDNHTRTAFRILSNYFEKYIEGKK